MTVKKSFTDLIKEVVEEESQQPEPANEPIIEVELNEEQKEQKKQVIEALQKTTSDKTAEKLLMATDPRNQQDYMDREYLRWARNDTKRVDAATWASRFSFWLGSILVGSPEKMGVPDFIYYLPQDRFVCFPFHFNEKTIRDYDVSRFILFSNQYGEERRNELAVRLSIILLIFSFGIGAVHLTTTKLSDKYHSIVAKFHADDEAKKNREIRLKDLNSQAKQLVADYKANKIDEATFDTKANELKSAKKQIEDESTDK